MKTFRGFLRDLEALEWNPVGYVDPGVLAVLAELGRRPGLIYDTVSSWSTESLEKRQLCCHETSTHYKWFLYYHKELHFKVWLHQFKPAIERQVGHAEVPHNHRYSLASLILRGGFLHQCFDKLEDELAESLEDRRRYNTGDAYVVEWQRLHKLGELSDHTVTLVIESPLVRHFSEAFYPESRTPRIFYDFAGLHAGLSEEISSL